MNHPARAGFQAQIHFQYGRLISKEDQGFVVAAEFGSTRAEQAASCLLEPQPGDEVLLSLDTNGRCFILAVLRRAAPETAADLVLEGQHNLRVKNGGLSVFSEQDLFLTAGDELAVTSSRLAVHTGAGEAAVDKFTFLGRLFKSQFERIKCVARSVDQICGRLTQHLEESLRYVSDHEEVQTGSTRILVEDTLTLHSKNAVHMAEEIVKINAEQVHLG